MKMMRERVKKGGEMKRERNKRKLHRERPEKKGGRKS